MGELECPVCCAPALLDFDQSDEGTPLVTIKCYGERKCVTLALSMANTTTVYCAIKHAEALFVSLKRAVRHE